MWREPLLGMTASAPTSDMRLNKRAPKQVVIPSAEARGICFFSWHSHSWLCAFPFGSAAFQAGSEALFFGRGNRVHDALAEVFVFRHRAGVSVVKAAVL